jgi:hypothetical protein
VPRFLLRDVRSAESPRRALSARPSASGCTTSCHKPPWQGTGRERTAKTAGEQQGAGDGWAPRKRWPGERLARRVERGTARWQSKPALCRPPSDGVRAHRQVHRLVEGRLAAHILVRDARAELDRALLQRGALREAEHARQPAQDQLVAVPERLAQVAHQVERSRGEGGHDSLVEVWVPHLRGRGEVREGERR